MPHGYCYLWNPSLVWLHVVSDALIALAYFSIPVTLIYFIYKRRDLPFHWMFVSFGMFILACGATHTMEVWTIWPHSPEPRMPIRVCCPGRQISTAYATALSDNYIRPKPNFTCEREHSWV